MTLFGHTPAPAQDERVSQSSNGSVADRHVSPFVEKISTWLVAIAGTGAFVVLLEPSVSGQVYGFAWKIGVGAFSAELKGAVVNTMLLGGFSGVMAFWLGATKSQERSSDSLARIAETVPMAAAAAGAAAAGVGGPSQAPPPASPPKRE